MNNNGRNWKEDRYKEEGGAGKIDVHDKRGDGGEKQDKK